MRTTKVKRLWPVLALAPLFALAAFLVVSLWHNGPTAPASPPSAEAQGRAPDATVIPYDDPCTTGQANANTGFDQVCITDADSLRVIVDPVSGTSYAYLYVTGASGFTGTPSDVNVALRGRYPKIQAKEGTTNFGKEGVAEFSLVPDDTRNPADGYIVVRRSWADAKGEVYVFIKEASGDWTRPTSEEATVLPDFDNAGAFAIVKVIFTQGLALNNSMTIEELNGNSGNLPARNAGVDPAPTRSFGIAAAEGGDADTPGTADTPGVIAFEVNPVSGSTGLDGPSIGGKVEVVTTFTEGSALRPNTSSPRTETFGVTEGGAAVAPGATAIPINASTTGWAHQGPVEASVVITHIGRDDTRTPFDPIVFTRPGPVKTIGFEGTGGVPEDPHRTTSGTTYSGFGKLEFMDALGNPATTVSAVIYEGADATAAAILPDDEDMRTLNAMALAADNFAMNIEEDAATGQYTVNFLVKGGTEAMPTTLATLPVTINVIGAPETMSGELEEDLVNPNGMLKLRNVELSTMGESAYATPCSATALGTDDDQTATTNSLCRWAGKTDADKAILGEGGMGLVQYDGAKDIPVLASAQPGEYTIVLSDARTGLAAGEEADSAELQFKVRGRPSVYTMTGPDRIAAGQFGAFTVTAKDVNNNVPYLPDTPARQVPIVISGDASSVTPLRLTDGAVLLDTVTGTASFQVQVHENAPSGSITVVAVGLDDGLASKTVAVGPLTLGAASGVMGEATVDGSAASVALTWTAGDNATRHWIAGIKQSDWDANNFDNVIWGATDSNTMHTVPDLEVGQAYVFTIAAGNAGGEWSAWAPLFRITPRAASTGGGGGPANPFGGNQ